MHSYPLKIRKNAHEIHAFLSPALLNRVESPVSTACAMQPIKTTRYSYSGFVKVDNFTVRYVFFDEIYRSLCAFGTSCEHILYCASTDRDSKTVQ